MLVQLLIPLHHSHNIEPSLHVSPPRMTEEDASRRITCEVHDRTCERRRIVGLYEDAGLLIDDHLLETIYCGCDDR